MKKIILTALFFMSVVLANAFSTSGGRSWSAGALTWDDFKATPSMTESPAYITTELLQIAETNSKNGMQKFSIFADAVVFPMRSYAAANEQTEQKLRYFQAQFDLLELVRRRYQRELASGVNGIEADRRLTFYRNFYADEVEKMKTDTDNGNDDAKLQYYEYTIRRELEEVGIPPMPEVIPSPCKYGLFIGLGGSWPTTDISRAFSGSFNFTFGALFSYRRFNLEASISYGVPSIKNKTLVNAEYEGLGYRANVGTANYLAIGFNGGFSVLDTKHFTIAPYIGGMWTSYSWTARQMNNVDGIWEADGLQNKMDISDFNLTFGVNFEWHFHSVVTNFPIFGSLREEYISSLRLTPYFTKAVYEGAIPHYKGWQIGFMVSYSGIGRALGIK